VIEVIDGEGTHHEEVQRHPDVVTELEERYIFFAKQADIARRELRLGHSCAFNVYFRERPRSSERKALAVHVPLTGTPCESAQKIRLVFA
jgi:hypothetical protein